jgi:hypothetical protein
MNEFQAWGSGASLQFQVSVSLGLAALCKSCDSGISELFGG